MKLRIVALVSVSDVVNHHNYWGTLAQICTPNLLLHAETWPNVYGRPAPSYGLTKRTVSLAQRDGDESPLMDLLSFTRDHINER